MAGSLGNNGMLGAEKKELDQIQPTYTICRTREKLKELSENYRRWLSEDRHHRGVKDYLVKLFVDL